VLEAGCCGAVLLFAGAGVQGFVPDGLVAVGVCVLFVVLVFVGVVVLVFVGVGVGAGVGVAHVFFVIHVSNSEENVRDGLSFFIFFFILSRSPLVMFMFFQSSSLVRVVVLPSLDFLVNPLLVIVYVAPSHPVYVFSSEERLPAGVVLVKLLMFSMICCCFAFLPTHCLLFSLPV